MNIELLSIGWFDCGPYISIFSIIKDEDLFADNDEGYIDWALFRFGISLSPFTINIALFGYFFEFCFNEYNTYKHRQDRLDKIDNIKNRDK